MEGQHVIGFREGGGWVGWGGGGGGGQSSGGGSASCQCGLAAPGALDGLAADHLPVAALDGGGGLGVRGEAHEAEALVALHAHLLDGAHLEPEKMSVELGLGHLVGVGGLGFGIWGLCDADSARRRRGMMMMMIGTRGDEAVMEVTMAIGEGWRELEGLMLMMLITQITNVETRSLMTCYR